MSIKKEKRYLAVLMLSSGMIAVFIYMLVRTLLFLYSGYHGVEKILSVVMVVSEVFLLMHTFGYMLNVVQTFLKKKQPDVSVVNLSEEELASLPAVAVLVAARHEPKEVLEDTFITLNNMNYPNKKIYFLDDSSLEKYKKEAEELVAEYNLILFRREERHGAKAGIVNDCLKTLSEKYIAAFDADQNPLPEFLAQVVFLLEKDDRLGFVQTPQFYTNIESSLVARGAAFQQSVFYEYICEGKSLNGSMFCCGTNVVFRKEALLDVGGFDESSVTEDFATSLKIHQKKWKSLYFNHVQVFGMGPEDLEGYFKQQFRWAKGTIGMFKTVLKNLILRPRSLTLMQWYEYLLSSSYYLVGLSYFFLMLAPILYLLFGIPSFFAKPQIYFTAFLPYILFAFGLFYIILRTRNYRIKDLFVGQLLGLLAFPVYIKAAIYVLLGVKTTFGITAKTKGKSISYLYLWPQLGLLFFNFIALVWGINRFVVEHSSAILVNSFWALYHICFLYTIFIFNKE